MSKTCTKIRRCSFILSMPLLGCLVVVDTSWAQSEVSFTRQDFAVGDGPFSVVVGDFNGNGQQDLATANGGASSVSILLGNGDGTFEPAQDFPVEGQPQSVAIGDFNGDDRQDLATANFVVNSVSILLGQGDGTFGLAQDFAVGEGPFSVTVGDFNGDGRQDLATANIFSDVDGVSVLLGQGDGTFGPAQAHGVEGAAGSVTVGDFNSDGRQDLATASSFGVGSVSILLGRGDGTFEPAHAIVTGQDPRSIAVGDFNSDGRQDLATANAGASSVSILLGNGDGTFVAPQEVSVGGGQPRSITVGDFNGDGQQDVATASTGSSSVTILLGRGDSTFLAPQDVAVADRPFSVTVGDFNGDGQQDVATANLDTDTVSILINNAAVEIEVKIDIKPGSFPNTINPRSNGVIPIAILTTDTFDATTVNSTTVRFGATGTEAGPVHAALEDVNTDGHTDLLLHFRTQNTGIVCGSTSSSLTGKTFGGQSIQGSDSVRTVGCK